MAAESVREKALGDHRKKLLEHKELESRLRESDVQPDACISREDLENVKRHWEERLSSEPLENLFPKLPQSKPARPTAFIDLDKISDNVETESTDLTLRKHQWEQIMQESHSPLKTPAKSPFPRDENGQQDLSAIEMEIRMAEERETQLRRERGSVDDVDAVSDDLVEAKIGTGPEVTYNEMTEADRGSQLAIQHNIILQDIAELKRREEEVKRDQQRAQLARVTDRPARNPVSPRVSVVRPPSENFVRSEMEVFIKPPEHRTNENVTIVRGTGQNLTPDNIERRVSQNSYSEVLIADSVKLESAPETESEPVKMNYSPRKISSSSPRSVASQSPVPSPPTPPVAAPPWKGMPDIASFEQRQGGNVIIRDMQEYQDRLRELEEQRRKLGQTSGSDNKQFTEVTVRPSHATPDNVYRNDMKPIKGSVSMDFARRSPSDSTLRSASRSMENLHKPSLSVFAMDDDESERINLQPDTESMIARERRLVREREEEHRRSKGLEIKNEPKYVALDVNIDTRSSLEPKRTERSGSRTFASNQLRNEIKRQRQREMDLKKEGKIRTTSEDHIDVPYSGSGGMRRQLSLEGLLDGADDQLDGCEVVPRRTKTSVVDGERRKSPNPQQSIIEREMNEMRAREEELKSKRQTWAGQSGVTNTTAVYRI